LEKKIESGECDFDYLEESMKKEFNNKEPNTISSKQEKYESVFNRFI